MVTSSAGCTPPGRRLRHFVRRFPVRAQSDRTFDFGKPKLRGILPSRPDFTSSVQRPQKRSGHKPLRFSYYGWEETASWERRGGSDEGTFASTGSGPRWSTARAVLPLADGGVPGGPTPSSSLPHCCLSALTPQTVSPQGGVWWPLNGAGRATWAAPPSNSVRASRPAPRTASIGVTVTSP